MALSEHVRDRTVEQAGGAPAAAGLDPVGAVHTMCP